MFRGCCTRVSEGTTKIIVKTILYCYLFDFSSLFTIFFCYFIFYWCLFFINHSIIKIHKTKPNNWKIEIYEKDLRQPNLRIYCQVFDCYYFHACLLYALITINYLIISGRWNLSFSLSRCFFLSIMMFEVFIYLKVIYFTFYCPIKNYKINDILFRFEIVIDERNYRSNIYDICL